MPACCRGVPDPPRWIAVGLGSQRGVPIGDGGPVALARGDPRCRSGRRCSPDEGALGGICPGNVPSSTGEREGDLTGDVAPLKLAKAGHGEQSALPRRFDPPHEGDPAVDGRAAHGTSRARPSACLGAHPAPREDPHREGDRPGAVPASDQDPTGANHDDGGARATSVTPERHESLLGRPVRRGRPAELPNHNSVSDEHDAPPAARPAARRPCSTGKPPGAPVRTSACPTPRT